MLGVTKNPLIDSLNGGDGAHFLALHLRDWVWHATGRVLLFKLTAPSSTVPNVADGLVCP